MNKISRFLKKVIYAIGANLLSLIVSVLTTLIVPKFFGNDVKQFGYFQIYLFYTSYIGFFHLGWCDGILLRDGGKKYSELNKALYSAQFWLITGLQFIISFVIIIYGYFFLNSQEYIFICLTFAINIILFIPRTMLSYYLQATNRIKEYASITFVGRSFYGLSILAIVFLMPKNYHFFIWGDVLGKFFALLVSIWWCRDIVFSKPEIFFISFKEAIKNISVGIKLMFANIASMLITGIIRFGIQQKWNVETYGKVSFTLSVSNLFLTFISAIAIVLYPTLRQTPRNELPRIYEKMRNCLMIPLFGLMIVYYPVEKVLSSWLPQYSENLKYMAILFPMCIYAALMTLLIQTYMNVFRLEKNVLYINIFGLIFAFITTLISIYWLKNLTLAMLSMVLNQMFRCICAEIWLSKKLKVSLIKDITLEVVLTSSFICANWFIGKWKGLIVYTLVYSIYLLIKSKEIKCIVLFLKKNQKRMSDNL